MQKRLYHADSVPCGGAKQDCPKPTDGAPVVIALGGTGGKAAARLKKVDGQCRCLYIDCDPIALRENCGENAGDDGIEGFSLESGLRIFEKDKETALAELLQKYPREVLDLSAVRFGIPYIGTGCQRQIGRYLLADGAKALSKKLRQILEDAAPTASGKAHVHLIAGLGGGMGGGGFLELCALLRDAAEDASVQTRISGYFFLPDVSVDRTLPSVLRDRILANGYAALTELDSRMENAKKDEMWEQICLLMGISTTKPPLDEICLITALTPEGEPLPDGHERALDETAAYVARAISEGTSGTGVTAGNGRYTMLCPAEAGGMRETRGLPLSAYPMLDECQAKYKTGSGIGG